MFSFAKNSILVILGLLGSKMLSVLKELVTSMFFNREIQDVYIFATKIPALVRRSTVDGAVENAFIPSMSQFKEDLERSIWVSNATMLMFCLLGMISIFFMLDIISWHQFVFKTVHTKEFIDIFFCSMPCIPIYFLSGTCISIMHQYGIFLHTNIGQLTANIAMIFSIWLGSLYFPDTHYPFMIAAPCGASIHLIWQFYGLMKLNNRINHNRNKFLDLTAKILIVIIMITVITVVLMHLNFNKLRQYALISVLFLLTIILLFVVNMVLLFKYHTDNAHVVFGRCSHIKIFNIRNIVLFAVVIYLILQQRAPHIVVYPFIDIARILSIYLLLKSLCQFSKKICNKKVIFFAICSMLFNIWMIFQTQKHGMVIACIVSLSVRFFSMVHNSELIRQNEKFFRITINSMFATSVMHIIQTVSYIITSRVGVGVTSYLNRADKVLTVVNVVSAAPAIVLLPKMSEYIHCGKIKYASNIYKKAVLLSLMCMIPIIFFCYYNADFLCSVYLRGKTQLADISNISYVFCIQLFALPAHMLTKASSTIYFANYKSAFVAKSTLLELLVDVCLKVFCLNCIPNVNINMIATCSTVTAWLTALFLVANLRAKNGISLVL